VAALEATPMTIDEMRAMSPLRPSRVDLVAYVLLIAKCVTPIKTVVEPTADPLASGARRKYVPSLSFRISVAPPPPPPVVITPTVPPMLSPLEMGADAIVELAKRLEQESFFAILGLPENSSIDAVRAAYFRLAKVWHPRHLPPQLAWLKTEVQAIYERMSLAHKTLTDDQERNRYTTSSRPTLKRDRGEMLRQIDYALGHRDFAFAEGTARALLESDPGDAEALALVAWALCWAGDGPDESRSAARAMLDRAIAMDPHADRAFYFRALLRKKGGDAEGAYRDFVRTVQANPKHAEAEREAAAYEARAHVRRALRRR
jgi:curved DNA-binding protein CbpA